MKIYTEIIGNLQDPEWVKKAREAEIEYIDLDQWTAQKSRFVVKGDRENEYAVALKRHSQMLDGDIIRRFLSKGLSFSRDDRDENIRRIGFVASLVARHGGIAVVAAISPYRQARAEARRLVEEAGGLFLEVHVATPLALCAERDPKGLYSKARSGLIKWLRLRIVRLRFAPPASDPVSSSDRQIRAKDRDGAPMQCGCGLFPRHC